MGFALRQGNAGGCFPCGTCASGLSFTCVSRTGTGSLCGFSKYQNFSSGDWNLRKYTTVDTHGSGTICCYTTSTGCGSTGHAFTTTQTYSSNPKSFSGCTAPAAGASCTSTWVACSGGGSGTDTYLCNGQPGATAPFFNQTADDSACGGPTSSGTVLTITDTSKTISGNGCLPGSIPGSSELWSGSVIEELSVPDTVQAALIRGTSSVGSSCQTIPGTISASSAKSITAIALTGSTTSVVATIACTGLTIATNYQITATLTRRNSSTDAFISTTTVAILFTADATSDNVPYNVPIETGVKVNFDSADSIVAV